MSEPWSIHITALGCFKNSHRGETVMTFRVMKRRINKNLKELQDDKEGEDEGDNNEFKALVY